MPPHSDVIWKSDNTSAFTSAPPSLPASCDIVVVGAGITGLTAALALQKAGHNVLVIERGEVGGGTTGASSAHLTTAFDSMFSRVESMADTEAARVIGQAMTDAISTIERWSGEYAIDCGFTRMDGWYICEPGQSQSELADEFEAMAKAGLSPEKGEPNLPFALESAFRVPGQAVFDPLRYVQGLARAFTGMGGKLLERTPVLDWSGGSKPSVETPQGKLEARAVLLATHTPIGRSALHGFLKPQRSYLLALETESEIPDCLVWDMAEPYHYLRPINRDGQPPLLLVGGADHKTGKNPAEKEPYESLLKYAQDRFGPCNVVRKWSSQFYEATDGLPIVGELPLSKNVYTATGFDGDGLTLGTASGLAFADSVEGREGAFAKCCSPVRLKAKALPETAKFNLDAAKHMVLDRLLSGSETNLQPGEGAVVKSDGHQIAICRSADGEVSAVSAVCTHLGCIVHWNELEQSWDCPCHGSRFDTGGGPLEGPSRKPLKKLS